MSGYYGRMLRYQRIVEGLQLVLEELNDEDQQARQWIGKALQIMQEKLDMESEAFYQENKEEVDDAIEWERSFGHHDSEDD